ncbi:MAG: hypothetical protein DWQ35_19920 [Planctomycetota bacterium]|nr:MAG: hypothetical protein DWQ35_19920 [Planctomycetota bacterium]REK28409.1 MAG: hypothetical protein DWQ42_05380 [Planctomycetota bacterium]REK48425.1 MAG: hypothetical protein DWQ46_02530 [Planctomycetota bacterium]
MSAPEEAKSTIEEAAYHEVGHCYVAIRDAGRIVNWVEIHEEEGRYGGHTDVVPDYQNLLSWTTIAVAGIAAEARADAIRRLGGDRMMVTSDLVERLKDYVDEAEALARKKERVVAVQINFHTEGGQQAVSAISINDVRQMTTPYRDRISLKAALDVVVEMCQSDEHWSYIEALAKSLMGERLLRRTDIEKILGMR